MGKLNAMVVALVLGITMSAGCGGMEDEPAPSEPSAEALVGKPCSPVSGGPLPTCGTGEYCDVGPACSTTGACRLRPVACLAVIVPACGCDGTRYTNACAAARRGVSVKASCG